MNLRAFLATMSVFMLSHPLFCESQPTTLTLLEELQNFQLQKAEGDEQEIESILKKSIVKKFTTFYNNVLKFNDIPNLHPFFKSNVEIWNPEFEYNPFENQTSLKKIKSDPQIVRFVQTLEEYLNKFKEDFWDEVVIVDVFGNSNKRPENLSDDEKSTIYRNMCDIIYIKKLEFQLLNEIIDLFKVISTTKQVINIGIAGAGLTLLGGGLGYYGLDAICTSIVREAIKGL